MSQIAVYLGWYDVKVSGPFTLPTVEFMPGALAYHLFSYSAQTLRTTNEGWAAVLLQKGATCTMGMVDEPYLQFTPNVSVWLQAMVEGGYSFGEAAYASQSTLSWQTTILGDPLYRPLRRTRGELQKELAAHSSPLVEWFYVMEANARQAGRAGLAGAVAYLDGQSLARRGAVVTEKLGDLYLAQGKLSDALDMYEGALRRGPSPMQRLRLLLSLAEKQAALGADDKSLGWYELIFKEHPDYPDTLRLRWQVMAVAKRIGRTNLVEQCEKELQRLAPNGLR
jgi:tetratricopeptide (TPR) repeat protein